MKINKPNIKFPITINSQEDWLKIKPKLEKLKVIWWYGNINYLGFRDEASFPLYIYQSSPKQIDYTKRKDWAEDWHRIYPNLVNI